MANCTAKTTNTQGGQLIANKLGEFGCMEVTLDLAHGSNWQPFVQRVWGTKGPSMLLHRFHQRGRALGGVQALRQGAACLACWPGLGCLALFVRPGECFATANVRSQQLRGEHQGYNILGMSGRHSGILRPASWMSLSSLTGLQTAIVGCETPCTQGRDPSSVSTSVAQ